MKNSLKYAIRLINKYSGDGVWLGASYNTHDEAMMAAKEQCERCNRFEIHPVYADWVWRNKEVGFCSRREKDETRVR